MRQVNNYQTKGTNMWATNWTQQTDNQSAARRAGGRRGYNSRRQFQANIRVLSVMAELKKVGFGRGNQSEIARRLGVSRSVISRDFKKFALYERGYTWPEIEMLSKFWHHDEISRARRSLLNDSEV